MVERQLPMLNVVGSSPITRFNYLDRLNSNASLSLQGDRNYQNLQLHLNIIAAVNSMYVLFNRIKQRNTYHRVA